MIMDEEIGAPRLTSVVDPDKMYGKYWYRSGTNLSMTNQLKNIFSMSKKDILEMKKICKDSERFGYINFKEDIQIFLKKL